MNKQDLKGFHRNHKLLYIQNISRWYWNESATQVALTNMLYETYKRIYIDILLLWIN